VSPLPGCLSLTCLPAAPQHRCPHHTSTPTSCLYTPCLYIAEALEWHNKGTLMKYSDNSWEYVVRAFAHIDAYVLQV
jgi:hypothetical protein